MARQGMKVRMKPTGTQRHLRVRPTVAQRRTGLSALRRLCVLMMATLLMFASALPATTGAWRVSEDGMALGDWQTAGIASDSLSEPEVTETGECIPDATGEAELGTVGYAIEQSGSFIYELALTTMIPERVTDPAAYADVIKDVLKDLSVEPLPGASAFFLQPAMTTDPSGTMTRRFYGGWSDSEAPFEKTLGFKVSATLDTDKFSALTEDFPLKIQVDLRVCQGTATAVGEVFGDDVATAAQGKGLLQASATLSPLASTFAWYTLTLPSVPLEGVFKATAAKKNTASEEGAAPAPESSRVAGSQTTDDSQATSSPDATTSPDTQATPPADADAGSNQGASAQPQLTQPTQPTKPTASLATPVTRPRS